MFFNLKFNNKLDLLIFVHQGTEGRIFRGGVDRKGRRVAEGGERKICFVDDVEVFVAQDSCGIRDTFCQNSLYK